MQPYRLDIEPGSISAAKEWRHWLKTFENYIEVLTQPCQKREEILTNSKFLLIASCIEFMITLRKVKLMMKQFE